MKRRFLCFFCVHALSPSQQFFIHVRMFFPCLLGLTSTTKQWIKWLAQGESLNPPITSLILYH